MEVDRFELLTERIGLPDILDRFVPTTDPRCNISYARRPGVLIRSVMVERLLGPELTDLHETCSRNHPQYPEQPVNDVE